MSADRELVVDLNKYSDQRVRVRFTAGREGAVALFRLYVHIFMRVQLQLKAFLRDSTSWITWFSMIALNF